MTYEADASSDALERPTALDTESRAEPGVTPNSAREALAAEPDARFGPPLDLLSEPDEDGQQQSEPAQVRDRHTPRSDWTRLRALPWGFPLEEWQEHGVTPLTIRRGESRHQVLFVEVGKRRYAIKETSPTAAQKEINAYAELKARHCRTLEAVGYVITAGEPIPIGMVAGQVAYMSGDTGYCITRLAEKVLPQSILYRYPFTIENKRLLWNAIAELLLDLHEHGVYWGDPSLANVLMDLSGRRLTAVMADAETAEVLSGPLEEGLRRQDLDSFAESLEWLAEDIRIARGLPEEHQLVTSNDANYLRSRYAGLRAARQRAWPIFGTLMGGVSSFNRSVEQFNALGYGVINLGVRAFAQGQESVETGIESLESLVAPMVAPVTRMAARRLHIEVATLRPAWYSQRLRELLGVSVPLPYAQRIYQHINTHKWLLSQEADRDVGMDAAARDWYQTIHLPLLSFLDTFMPYADVMTTFAAYAAVLDHTWEMSQQEGRPVPIEEGAMDYALAQARIALPTPEDGAAL